MIDQPIIFNPAKEKIRRGEPIFGISVFESLSPGIVRVIHQSGYDMLMVDREHAIHNDESITSFILAARDHGLSPVVTVPTTDRILASRFLDAGALGINLCHTGTVEQVEEMVCWMKYPPIGERALALGPNANYRTDNPALYCQQANEATMLILKIESQKGVDNAKALLANEWVDAVVFGPGDLAADMGFHGQWEHPEVISAMESVIDVALKRGVAVEPSVFPSDETGYQRQLERGIQIFGPTRESEYQLLKKAVDDALKIYR